ncbi:type III secretion system export apparatus subunit SctT [Burkholderia ubonensis]|uniref:type III secretion system export apparatus subunit SctT n=1 Tax=Burkholderia ubonensis TaxID=101571 RepID=UPI000758B6D6|nr:type III secretion system export apparatus subunit SctT [Burkholderia ubonensis]KVX89288.1 type III secretion protein [Burkholderia ubonensis]
MTTSIVAEWLPVIALSTLRPLGTLLLMPVFNTSTLGGKLTRNALVLAIALPVLTLHDIWPVADSTRSWSAYLWLACGELGIGLMIGFCAAVPFWALDMAGSLIDTMRGASMASILNPLLGQQSSLIGIVFSQVFSLLFMMFGGFHALLEALYASYVTLPPGSPFHFRPSALGFLSQQWQMMYTLFLRFAMPAIVAILLVDMALGLINRSAQQLNVFFVAMPIKSGLALLLLIICANFAFQLPLADARRLVGYADALTNLLR